MSSATTSTTASNCRRRFRAKCLFDCPGEASSLGWPGLVKFESPFSNSNQFPSLQHPDLPPFLSSHSAAISVATTRSWIMPRAPQPSSRYPRGVPSIPFRNYYPQTPWLPRLQSPSSLAVSMSQSPSPQMMATSGSMSPTSSASRPSVTIYLRSKDRMIRGLPS